MYYKISLNGKVINFDEGWVRLEFRVSIYRLRIYFFMSIFLIIY